VSVLTPYTVEFIPKHNLRHAKLTILNFVVATHTFRPLCRPTLDVDIKYTTFSAVEDSYKMKANTARMCYILIKKELAKLATAESKGNEDRGMT
jgi:hypothetical protein